MSTTREAPLPVLAKLRLITEIIGAYVLVRRTLRRRGLKPTLEALRSPITVPGRPLVAGQTSNERRRLARAVIRTLALVPADSRCLMRSLVLTRMLARRGVASQLVIAISPGERFAAHSWVERNGEVLLPPGSPAMARLVTL